MQSVCACVSGVHTCALPNLKKVDPAIEAQLAEPILRIIGHRFRVANEQRPASPELFERRQNTGIEFERLLSRCAKCVDRWRIKVEHGRAAGLAAEHVELADQEGIFGRANPLMYLADFGKQDRKSTRLTSSHYC